MEGAASAFEQVSTGQGLLRELCRRLRDLHDEAGGPPLRDLGAIEDLPQASQLSMILNGKIKRLPSWSVVAAIVMASKNYGAEHHRTLTSSTDIKVWRSLFNAIEFALEYERAAPTAPQAAASTGNSAGEIDVVAINGLPRDVPDFTGRDAEIRYIVEALTRARNSGVALAIHAVSGMGGIGKTTLAVHVSHLLAHEYSEAIFIDLRAHNEGQAPYDPGDALVALLTMVGVDGDRIPDQMDAKIAMWRSQIARRKALLILDNAASAEQLRPLLPGRFGGSVLITSRVRLLDLEGVIPLELDPLPEQGAVKLFVEIAGSHADDEVIGNLVKYCGRLPLAIRLAAAWLRHHPAQKVAELERSLSLALEPVASVFALSCRDLDEEERTLFRRLALHPGTTLTTELATAISRTGQARTARIIEALYSRHLIEEPIGGRYKFHDLIRGFARQMSESEDSADERRQVLELIFGYYVEAFKREGGDASWVDAEYPNLIACADEAITREITPFAWILPKTIAVILQLRGAHVQSEHMQSGALKLAVRHNDRMGQAGAHAELGVLARHRGDLETARMHTAMARSFYADSEHTLELANCDTDLGVVERDANNFDAARLLFSQAIGLYSELGNAIGQANAHAALGELERQGRNHRDARAHAERALELYLSVSNKIGEANIHANLGDICLAEGDHEEAEEHLRTAQRLHRETNNHTGEAAVGCQLAFILEHRGDISSARGLLLAALSIYSASGDGEAEVVREKLRALEKPISLPRDTRGESA